MLEKTVLGCDWILTRWELLAASLETSTFWTAAECTLGVNLLGEVMNTASVANEAAAALRLNAFAARAERVPDQVDAFWGTSTKHLDPEARQQAIEASLPDRATAHTALSAIIAAEMARVEALRAVALEGEKAELTDAANRASFDTLDDATLMRRYETAHSLDLHRCLGQLVKMRKLESACQPTPEAAIHPAAEPAAAPPEPIRNEPTAAGPNGQKTSSGDVNGAMNASNRHSRARRNGSHKRSRGPKEVVETSATVAAPD
jgi:hypothetical protein